MDSRGRIEAARGARHDNLHAGIGCPRERPVQPHGIEKTASRAPELDFRAISPRQSWLFPQSKPCFIRQRLELRPEPAGREVLDWEWVGSISIAS